MSGTSGSSKAEMALREIGLSYPGATEDFPWGHRVLKVKGKAFIFMGTDEAGEFGVTVKLPESGTAALALPFCEPAGYGLGKSGWVSARFKGKNPPPIDLLSQWLKESYLAVAPKKLAAELLGGAQAKAGAKSPAPVKKAPSPERAMKASAEKAAKPKKARSVAKASASSRKGTASAKKSSATKSPAKKSPAKKSSATKRSALKSKSPKL